MYLFTLFLCVRTCAHTCSQLPKWTIFLWSPGNSFLWPGWASSHGGEIFFSAVIQAVAIIVAGGVWTLGPFSDFVSSTLQVTCCQRPTGINSRPFKTQRVMHTKYDMRVAGKIGEHHVECLECSYFGLVVLDLVTYQHVHRFFLLRTGKLSCEGARSNSRRCLVSPLCSPCLWDEGRVGQRLEVHGK